MAAPRETRGDVGGRVGLGVRKGDLMDLRGPQMERAIGNVERRAEREAGYRRLYDIYVDRGVLSELSSSENQIVYGRRGVGKTHLFLYYRDYLLTSGQSLLFPRRGDLSG